MLNNAPIFKLISIPNIGFEDAYKYLSIKSFRKTCEGVIAMVKDVLTVLGIDGFVGTLVWAFDPGYLKWVLAAGILSLIGLFLLTKQGRVSIYGTQLVMALVLITHFA